MTLLLVVLVVPVMAAERPGGPETGGTPPPVPENFYPSNLPSTADITGAIEEAELEEAKQEAWLASPEAIQQREESRHAYADLDRAGIEDLVERAFADQLAQLDADPARFLSQAQLLSTSEGDRSATVSDEGEHSVLESTLPVRTEDENGELGKVDVGLEKTESGFETENALVDVTIPKDADQPIELGEEGVSIALVGADEGQVAQPFGGESTLATDVLPDTDVMVSPLATGVEIFNILRSEDSPEIFRFQVAVPAGAELRAAGEWGAEIVKDGDLLTTIPEPVAVDAQGTEVPVDLQVEGNSLVLGINHRDGDYAMPIMLDPQVLENNQNWIYGENHDVLDMGIWAFQRNVEGMYGWTYCIYECFGPGGTGTRGLYISAQPGAYWPGQWAQWIYGAPNDASYISQVTLGAPYVHADHGCPESQYPKPHNYFGVWSKHGFWVYLSVNSANQPGGSYTLPFAGDAVIFGLSTGGAQYSIGCWRDLYAGGAHIWLDDWSQPVLTTHSSGQWMDTVPSRLNVSASDPGLGVRKFDAEAVNWWGGTERWETWHPCSGTRRSPCPQTWNLADPGQPQLAYSPAGLPEGIVNLNVTAYDATLRKSTTTNGMTLRVDHFPPSIKLSGTITEQATLGTEKPRYTVRAEASDGIPNDPNPANARSGVVGISEWVDGKVVNVYAPGCPTQSCSYFDEGAIEAAAYSKGQHTLTVFAVDALGHASAQQIAFSVGDSRAPSLDVAGLPEESSALPTQPVHWNAFGSSGAGDGQMKSPSDIAVDAAGDIWIADKGNNRIEKFTADGQFLARFGSTGSGNGQFSSPAALAIDAQGNILVADRGNGRVQKFNAKGEYLAQFGSKGPGIGQFAPGGPEGIALDPKGNIWVADTYGGRLQKLDQNGNFLKIAGSEGSGPGQLGEPVGIDVAPNGDVWVADRLNNRVAVFNEAGEFLRQFGSIGSGEGQFDRPGAIAVGSRGDVWVGDQNNSRVQEFDQNGTYLGQFGSKGSGQGQFNFSYPMGVATDSKGSVWVADTNNHRVQRWLAPTTIANGYFAPLNASAADSGFGVKSIAVKLVNQAGETNVLGQTSQACTNGGCPLNYSADDLDLSEHPSGTYLLMVVATDGAGNQREVTRVLRLDSTPPQLDLSGPLAESAGGPVGATSAELQVHANDGDPAGGVTKVNVERDGQLVASYISDCASDCHDVEASYTFQTASDGADRAIEPVAKAGNGSIGELKRVACVAKSDCWALGRTKYTATEEVAGKVAEQLLEHWNGSNWQATSVPKPEGATSLHLEGISCPAPDSCLAVGYYHNGTNQPLAVHWDGSEWSSDPVTLPGGAGQGYLYGASCGAADDCWSYGKTEATPTEQSEGKAAAPFFAHWNGGNWQATSVPKPEGATSLHLEGISCPAPDSCLAVGYYHNGTNQPLAAHWDGSEWSSDPVTLPGGAGQGYLYGASCGAADDCWAYGNTEATPAEQSEGNTAAPFFAHWISGEWQAEITADAPDGSPTTVRSLSCASVTSCTAVGRYTNPHGETLPIAYTWDVAGWRYQPMPIRTDADNSSLEDVACTDANECVSVGYSRVDSDQWQVLGEVETADGGPHEIMVEAVDALGNATSKTIEIAVDPASAMPAKCDSEPALEASKGVLSSTQAVNAIEQALPAAVAPTDGAPTPATGEVIDPTYSPPAPNLETLNSLATGETSVHPEGGFTLGDSVCIAPATLTPAATDARVVNEDAALFANTSAETDTVIRPTAFGATVIQAIRGPDAPEAFAWTVKVAPGQELVELPSGGAAVVEIGSIAGDMVPPPEAPDQSPTGIANVEAQVANGEYGLIQAAEETELEVVAVIAQPWVVLAQGGIVPALIEVVPDTETPNEFEVWMKLSISPEEEAVWPAHLIADMAGASALNGSCSATDSPCGWLDLDKMAQYAMYWGNEAHHYARNPFYADYKSNNCTNFISQILRAGGAKFMRAFEHGDGSWWYFNYARGGVMGNGPYSGWDDTESWRLSDVLPRHLWRFGLAHIDPVQKPRGWTRGNIIAYDWIDSDGKGNINHLNFAVGTVYNGGDRIPLIANSSDQGANYSQKLWIEVRQRIAAAHGSQWTRFALAAKHRVANLKAKKHDPDNLYGPSGLFRG